MLKILLDEDVRGKAWDKTIERLQADRHDIIRASERAQGLRGMKDHELGKLATEQGRLIVTRDKRSFQHENFKHEQTLPFGLVALRINELSPEARAERVSSFIQQQCADLHKHSTVLEPATERMKPMPQAYQEFQNNMNQTRESQPVIQNQNHSLKP